MRVTGSCTFCHHWPRAAYSVATSSWPSAAASCPIAKSAMDHSSVMDAPTTRWSPRNSSVCGA
ncbi:Uncharacterised protein [Mycobacteroides abscessus]|nr:Uncharacterised protein [Mycobacteroides abscessus]